MSVEKKLPAGWEVKRLGEVCEILNGSTPSKSDRSFWEDGHIPWFTIDDIREQGRIICRTKQSITQKALDSTSVKLLPKQTVLLCCTASVGEYALTEIELTTNQQFNGLISKDTQYLSPNYLFRYVSILKDELLAISGTTTISFIPISRLKNINIKIPPLSEQKRIVAILDEAFQAIDRAKENAEKNLANAREVFDSYLNQVFSNPGKDWEEKKLGEVCDIKHGFAFDGKDFSFNEDPSKSIVLTPGNFTEDAKLLFNSKNTKRFTGSIATEWLLNKGELVVVMTDLSTKMKILGKPAIISQENILHNQRIGRFIFSKQDIDLKLVYYFLQTKAYFDNIKETSTGTMVKHTAPKRILDNRISYPRLYSNQRIIVTNLDNAFIKTRCLESIYQQKLAALDELKKSILQKAFSGEL